jgi:flavodoxin
MSKVLVAYFSASGVTAKVAREIAKVEGADLFEIRPETPYTAADLDWRDKQSRSTLEMSDPDCRPPVSGKVEDMERYAVVFVGFPVWWGREPSVVDTFLDAYDFTGKTVVPFATSGTSPLGDEAPANIQALAPGAKVADGGKRFPAKVSAEELKEWASAWL